MNGTAHAGLGYLALMVVLAVLVVRYAVTGGTPAKHRAPRRRRVEEFVPGHYLIPALAHGAVAAQAFAYCRPCGGEVPAVVNDGAHRCDAGHITIHTTTGSAL